VTNGVGGGVLNLLCVDVLGSVSLRRCSVSDSGTVTVDSLMVTNYGLARFIGGVKFKAVC